MIVSRAVIRVNRTPGTHRTRPIPIPCRDRDMESVIEAFSARECAGGRSGVRRVRPRPIARLTAPPRRRHRLPVLRRWQELQTGRL